MKTFNKTLMATAIAIITTSAYADGNHIARVDSHGKVLQDYSLTKEAGEVQQQSVKKPVESVEGTQITVDDVSYTGQAAIDFLGGNISDLAKKHNYDEETLKKMILQDSTIHIDSEGRMIIVEEIPATYNKPQASTFAYNGDAYKLHSKPGAKKLIYIDVDGFDTTGTAWSGYSPNNMQLEGWAKDNGEVYALWAMISEDYAPFDVDVTTEKPTYDAITKSDDADTEYGVTLVVTNTNSSVFCGAGGCGGLAYVGSSQWNGKGTPALVFANSAGVFAKSVSEAASHEIGHTLNLLHDGTSTSGYYCGDDVWAPLMGCGYGAKHSQFSKGDYPDANNHEDDLAIIAQVFPYNPTDIGGTFDTAVGFETSSIKLNSTVISTVSSIIESATDKDAFSFTTIGGYAKFTVTPNQTLGSGKAQGTDGYANMKPKVTLYDENNKVVAMGQYLDELPTLNYQATISGSLPAGKYYLIVESGELKDKFPTYGSIGQYKIDGQYTSSTAYVAPTAKLVASTTNGVGPLTVMFDGTGSTLGTGTQLRYKWTIDGVVNELRTPTNTYSFNVSGDHTVILTVSDENDVTDVSTIKVHVDAPLTKLVRVDSVKLALQYHKNWNMTSASTAIKLVNERNKPVKNVRICGEYTGSLNSTMSLSPTIMCGTTTASGITKFQDPVWMFGKYGTLIFTVTRMTNTNMVLDLQGSKQISGSITK